MSLNQDISSCVFSRHHACHRGVCADISCSRSSSLQKGEEKTRVHELNLSVFVDKFLGKNTSAAAR